MMSLINTNYDYLETLQITETDPLVAVIVAVYYLGCAAGSVLASLLADKKGRKTSIFVCLATTALGNFIMFISGLGGWNGPAAIATMITGRTIMGLGVGGIDAVIPVYSSELNEEGGRGRALAQEFQANILGLNMAFLINILLTRALGKNSQWAWRTPIIAMQIYPVLLMSFIYHLPESPRWHMSHEQDDKAKQALKEIYNDEDAEYAFEKLETSRKEEESEPVTYVEMLFPWGSQYHPTMVTIWGQINQALTGVGAISVYGPQLFELLGFGVEEAEDITIGNYVLYFFMMTFAWLLIDKLGRRKLMLSTSAVMTGTFVLLTIFGALVMEPAIDVPKAPFAILGVICLYVYTSAFGIGWLAEPWLIPTELYPSPARAKGAAISVVVWGFANFAITFLTPILFNNLSYWIFLIFAFTNAFAGWWTWVSSASPFTAFDLTTDYRPFLQKLEGELSKRTHNSLRMQKSTTLGKYERSTTVNFEGYLKERRAERLERRLPCSEAVGSPEECRIICTDAFG